MAREAGLRGLRLLAVAFALGYPILVWAVIGLSAPPDAMTYLAAGERLNAGHPLYSLSPGDRPVTNMVPTNPYPLLSPPAIAVLWRPLAAIGQWTVVPWTIALSAAFASALAVLGWRSWPTVFLAILVLEPITWLVAVGNIHALIAAGIPILWLVRDRPWAAAAVAVSMTAVKLTPLPLVVWVARDRRAWLPIATVGVCWLAATELFAPGATLEYLQVMNGGAGGTRWLLLVGGLAATVLLPSRFGFLAAVLTSIFGTDAAGVHWLAMLPMAISPWVFPPAVARPEGRSAVPGPTPDSTIDETEGLLKHQT